MGCAERPGPALTATRLETDCEHGSRLCPLLISDTAVAVGAFPRLPKAERWQRCRVRVGPGQCPGLRCWTPAHAAPSSPAEGAKKVASDPQDQETQDHVALVSQRPPWIEPHLRPHQETERLEACPHVHTGHRAGLGCDLPPRWAPSGLGGPDPHAQASAAAAQHCPRGSCSWCAVRGACLSEAGLGGTSGASRDPRPATNRGDLRGRGLLGGAAGQGCQVGHLDQGDQPAGPDRTCRCCRGPRGKWPADATTSWRGEALLLPRDASPCCSPASTQRPRLDPA